MSFIKNYLEYTANQETTERVHKWVALSVIAGALERRVWLPRGNYTLFPNLYVFVIGPSGKVKKSTSTALGVDLLRELPEFKIMSERATAASLITQLERSSKTFTFNGREIKQSPSFAYASELNVFLGEVFGSITELLTTFYDCQPQDSSKPWTYETRSSGIQRIYGPCLNILGASTPSWLKDSVPVKSLEGGFASRVIFVVEQSMRRAIAFPDRERRAEDHEAQKRFLLSGLRRIYALKGPARITDECVVVAQPWYENHMVRGVADTDARFSGYYSRKFETALKIALLLSVSEGDSLVIELSHFEEALSLLADVELQMMDAFAAAGDNPNAALTEKVWRLVAAQGRIRMAHLITAVRHDAGIAKLAEVVQDLRAMGRVKNYAVSDELGKDMIVEAVDPGRPL